MFEMNVTYKSLQADSKASLYLTTLLLLYQPTITQNETKLNTPATKCHIAATDTHESSSLPLYKLYRYCHEVLPCFKQKHGRHSHSFSQPLFFFVSIYTVNNDFWQRTCSVQKQLRVNLTKPVKMMSGINFTPRFYKYFFYFK